ncbi:M15 family metallopeptidase domain-containing protein [Microbacterium xylanilyticum]
MTTDLGHGRGWAADEAAASIFRIDQQLGRPAQITEAGRSIEEADKNYAAYRAYVEGRGPWAPLALPGSKSVHCKGYASDTDAYKDPHEDAVWEDNGWIQTARYDDPDEDEPWHREYFRDRDNHRNDPAPTTTESPEEDDEMNKDKYCWLRRADGVIVNVIYNTGSGYYQPWESNNGEYNTRKARGHDLAGPTFEVTPSDLDAIAKACADVRGSRA